MKQPLPATLGRALDISMRMLEAGKAGAWTQVEDLRMDLQGALDTLGPPENDIREAYAVLVSQQRQLATLATQAQHRLGEELAQFHYRQRAMHAYLDPRRHRHRR